MSLVSVKLEGGDKAKSRLRGQRRGLADGVKKGVRQIADELAADIEADTPVDTGDLKSTVHVEGGDTVVIGGGHVNYATYVEADQWFIEPNVQRAINDAGGTVSAEIDHVWGA